MMYISWAMYTLSHIGVSCFHPCIPAESVGVWCILSLSSYFINKHHVLLLLGIDAIMGGQHGRAPEMYNQLWYSENYILQAVRMSEHMDYWRCTL